ncbi:YhjD/YihY/BrkB family envelope integrity protein [Mycoplasma zalophi]|uniref:YhjD/YihY/BrkB family envelope integrity protein n=1 Tax=Mycoplasma zalophi TaxID=191287 RepID=UPI001C1056AB|nr:YhjD/YihY/BrkB family envelope integrity protein [Mycoplasma zalophi]MBU4690755.1 YihY/virulence factor BrkB family protein [Mycoplasma zalophi]
MLKKPKTGWSKRKKNKFQKFKHNINLLKFNSSANFVEKTIRFVIYFILKISLKKYLKNENEKTHSIVLETHKKLHSHEFAFIPSGFSLYLFMSFIPILSIISSIGYINQEYNDTIHFVLGKIIPGIENIIPNFFGKGGALSKTDVFVGVIFIISAFWISSAGYSKFVQSNSILYEHKNLGNWARNRLKGLWIVICMTILLFLVFLMFVSFLAFLKKSAGYTFSDWQFSLTFYLILPFLIFSFFFVVYILLYHYAPLFRLKYAYVMPGVWISTIPTSIFVIIFGFLTSLFNYKKFGLISSFMYIELFLITMSYFTYTGVLINATFYKTFISTQTIDKKLDKMKKHS